MYYYTTPSFNVALNAKVGSSTIARCIIREFYPDINEKILKIKNPPHISDQDRQWHYLCPGTTKPDKPIILFVRDPVQRFLSACQQINVLDHNIEELLNSLIYDNYYIPSKYTNLLLPNREQEIIKINKINQQRYKNRLKKIKNGLPVMPKFRRYGFIRDDVHFFHQADYLQDSSYCFKFPENFHEGLEFIGIKKDSVPRVNSAKRQKISLNIEQLNSVSNYYCNDINLYNSISVPGKIIFRKDILCH